MLPLGQPHSLRNQPCSPFLSWLPEFCFQSHPGSTALACLPAPLRNSDPQTPPAGYGVCWKVPMELTFPILSPAGQASPALPCLGKRVISETASLKTRFLPNLSFLLTPTQTQTEVSFPFSSPCLPRLFLCYVLRAQFRTPWVHPSWAPKPTPTGNTPSFHHCPPSNDSQLWMVFRKLLQPSLH